VKYEITFSHWTTNCSDGCCYEDGREIFINGVSVIRNYSGSLNDLELIFRALGLNYELTIEYDDYDHSFGEIDDFNYSYPFDEEEFD
jgi:hypothetical protein